MVDYVADANELARRIRLFAFGGHAPEQIANRLQTIPGVTADLICETGEILYAHKDLLDEEGIVLLGEIYQHADKQGWSTFNGDGRSAAIVALVARDLGEKGPAVAKKADEWPEPQVNRRDDNVDWRSPAPSEEADGSAASG